VELWERGLPMGVVWCRDEGGGRRAVEVDAGVRQGRPVVGMGAPVHVCGERREKRVRVVSVRRWRWERRVGAGGKRK
jgi:hypothetical protein